jgi:hypothetical protein
VQQLPKHVFWPLARLCSSLFLPLLKVRAIALRDVSWAHLAADSVYVRNRQATLLPTTPGATTQPPESRLPNTLWPHPTMRIR